MIHTEKEKKNLHFSSLDTIDMLLNFMYLNIIWNLNQHMCWFFFILDQTCYEIYEKCIPTKFAMVDIYVSLTY